MTSSPSFKTVASTMALACAFGGLMSAAHADTTVHDDGAQAREAQEDDVLGKRALQRVVGHGVAAVLDDDGGAAEALEPRQRLGEDGRLVLRAHVEYAEFSWT